MGSRGQSVRVSEAGVEVLRREYTEYHTLFDRPSKVIVKGTVMTGLGEGKYYIGQEGYLRQFSELLGFPPMHGTLNLSLDGDGMNQLARLREAADMVAAGFEEEGRTFGAVKCVPCKVRGVEAAVIIPIRTHHRNVMELISEHHLRDRFGLEDGDEVEVVVETPRG
jgi:riboflavin kinase